jgi:hypothetical protein
MDLNLNNAFIYINILIASLLFFNFKSTILIIKNKLYKVTKYFSLTKKDLKVNIKNDKFQAAAE